MISAKALLALTAPFVVLAACGGENKTQAPTPSPTFSTPRTAPPSDAIVVTSAEDAGQGTLRSAISDANDERARPGIDAITFDFEAMRRTTVELDSQLPDIVSSIEIDGGGQLVLVGGGRDRHRHFYVSGSPTAGELTLRGVTLTRGGGAGTVTDRGGAIFNDGGTVTLLDSVVSESSASASGGIRNRGMLTIRNSTLRDNGNAFGCAGGAVDNKVGGIALIEASRIMSNTADVGGGIINDGGTMTIRDSQFTGNVALAWAGGGVLNDARGTLSISDSSFTENRAKAGAGVTNRATLIMERVELTRNVADAGGAVGNFGEGTSMIRDSLISDNIGEVGVGAILNGAAITLINSDIVNNEGAGSGAIFNAGTVTLEEVTIANNRAKDGLDADGAPIGGDGGAVFIHGEGSKLTVRKSELSGNIAEFGGGAIWAGSGAQLILENTTVRENEAKVGGALHLVDSSIEIIDSTLSNNRAEDGGAAFVNGPEAVLMLRRSLLSENIADGGGGAIFATSGAHVVIENTTVSGNEADIGAAVESDSSNVEVFFSTISENRVRTNIGVIHASSGVFDLQHSIIALNEGTGCEFGGGLAALTIGGAVSLGDDKTCVGIPGFSEVADPGLGELRENGGPTLTYALLPGSPGIDAVPTGHCLDANREPLVTDQRQVERPIGEGCDVGAVEN